jgi:FkbM family methyltransferase
MKNIVRTTVNRLGFDVVRLTNVNNDLAGHLLNVLTLNNIDCVIDVGANAGQYGQFLRGLGYLGFIVSFEPVKAAYERLQATASGDDKWLTYHLALGDKAEKKIINAYKSSVFSSFLNANEYSKGIWNSLETVTPEEVNVRRLDDIFAELVDRTNGTSFFLKMDTQGYDINVFIGGLASLSRVNGIQSEVSLIPVYDGMPPAYEVLNKFHEQDFYISGMYPINRDAASLAVIEYDCVMVKRHKKTS